MKYPKYPAYKESGTEWLGTIPNHWETLPIKYVASSNDDVLTEDTAEDFEIEYVEISGVDDVKGIFSTETHQFKNAPSRARRRVRNGDIIISTVRTYLKAIASIENPSDNLVVSTGFAVIRPKDSLFPRFASYLFKTNYLVHEVIARSTGISYPAINTSELVRICAVLPPYEEQRTIAAFLDTETAQIDTLIARQERLIVLLQEKRQALINRTVTKGVNPHVPMRDSGVEWIGEMPSHWQISRSKWLFRHRKERARPNDIQLSATQAYGVISQDEYMKRENRKVTQITEHLEKRAHVEVDDFVISMRSFEGGLERAWQSGCIRSSYVVLEPSQQIVPDFFTYLFKSYSYIQALRATSNFIRDGQDLNINNFTLVDLPLISVEEQRVIAAFLNAETAQIDTLIEKAKAAIERLNERRIALISAAVTGKIDVRAAMN